MPRSILQRILPPESKEDASWYSGVAQHRSLPTRTCVTTLSVLLFCVVLGATEQIKVLEAQTTGADPFEIKRSIRAAFGRRHFDQIWQGDWWGLLSAAALHHGILHLAFNMLWLHRLGCAIERAFGSLACLALMIGAAFVSSGFQMAVTLSPLTDPAGFSGVIYALAGFLWIAWRREPGVLDHFNASTAKFLSGWLVLCFILTEFGLFPVANTAHLTGLIFGLSAGAIVGFRGLKKWGGLGASIGMIAAIAAILHFGAPWSPVWHAHKAYRAHINFRLDEANYHYQWLREHPVGYIPHLDYNRSILRTHQSLEGEYSPKELRESYPVRKPFR